MDLITQFVTVAKSFVGQKETGANGGFADPKFLKEMQAVGWQKGQSWCAYFVELCAKETLSVQRPAFWNNIEDLFSASAVETLIRFQKKGYNVHQVPQIGDLVVWRFGLGPSGHIGIVVGVDADNTKQFTTVEGNTNGAGSANGDAVMIKRRRYGLAISSKPGAFNLLGFVSPMK